MKTYKRNPAITDSFFLNGKLVDDKTVLAGDEYEAFTVSIIPGRPPKLVRVEISELSRKEVSQVENEVREKAALPPRHLGPTTSENFVRTSDGGMSITSNPSVVPLGSPVTVEEQLRDDDVEDASSGIAVGEKKAPVVDSFVSTKKTLKEMYTAEQFIATFPGITTTNYFEVVSGAKTLEGLSIASNVDLRRWGVRSNFFSRLRERAKEIIGGQKVSGE